MEFTPTRFTECFEIQPVVRGDARGRFVKTFVASEFERAGLRSDFSEEYYSWSDRGIVRGLHFQSPPHDHAKLVYCIQGSVLDVLVDLRAGSPTYGQTQSFALSADNAKSVYIPAGVAHGFCTPSEGGMLVYKVTSEYAPANDTGVLWSSIDFEWPVVTPVVSERDTTFPSLAEFQSPFPAPGA